jgi:DNA repair protein RecN (Recombination protein N)
VLDVLAKNRELLGTYRSELRALRKLEQKLTELREEQARAIKEHDYNLFLVTELEEARLKNGMQEELEERYEELNNVEVLTEHLSSALNQVRQEEIGSLASLKM